MGESRRQSSTLRLKNVHTGGDWLARRQLEADKAVFQPYGTKSEENHNFKAEKRSYRWGLAGKAPA
ncbi:hypothetical protein HQN90_38450 [Paenibacillus alba]|nr:hypothetical protein [Paenibacillus alba]